jgi:hypothetical protein
MESNDRRGDSPQPAEGAVRVGRFDWERLMLMSDLPEPDRFKLLAVAVFMSADGGNVRPGNNGLAAFGPHADTWKKLLQRTVKAGWLIQVARGGARRGPNGSTLRRASVYAAAVPMAVWERRGDVLHSPPFRSAAVEGGAGSTPESGKGALDAPLNEAGALKGAPDAPFNAASPGLKGVSGRPLQGIENGAPPVLKGVPEVSKGAPDGFEGGVAAPPHHVVPSRSSSSSTSTTVVAEVSSSPAVRDGGTEGGGGVSPSEQNPGAEPLVAALDFRGRPPGAKQRGRLVALVAAALDAGWSEQDLKTYLDLGGAAVQSAAAVYVHRLGVGELPDAAVFRRAQERPLEGTDALVAGWGAVAASFDSRGPQRGYRPSNPNAVWEQLDQAAKSGQRPAGSDRVPHCGNPECDEITRTHEAEDWNGLKTLQMCTSCHPSMQF